MKSSLQFTDGKTRKFWEISVRGAQQTVRFGKIGTPGQTKITKFPDRASALRSAQRHILSKLTKGYRDGPSNSSSSARVAFDQAKARAEIWDAMQPHRKWMVAELKRLEKQHPPFPVKRVQLEYDPGAIHSSLDFTPWVFDREDDDRRDWVPRIRSCSSFFIPSVRRRLASTGDDDYEKYFDLACSLIERWVAECFQVARPKLRYPLFLSRHESLEQAVNLATGRSVRFRRS